MKRLMNHILFFIVIVFVQCNLAYATTVKISPATIDLDTVGVGGTFDVTVEVEDVYDLGGFEFAINYPSFLRVTNNDILMGDFLGSTGRSAAPLSPTITAEKLTYGAFSFGADFGPNGNGILATITFTVIDQANGTLEFSKSELLSSKSRSISHDKNGAKIICASCNDLCLGDINNDKAIDLKDAILTLKILSSMNVSESITVSTCTDINSDGRIGFEEILYILQKIRNVR